VVVFDETKAERVVRSVRPDILVKAKTIAGRLSMASGSSKDTADGSRWRRYSKVTAPRQWSRSCATPTLRQPSRVRGGSPGRQGHAAVENKEPLGFQETETLHYRTSRTR
jgi:hypothetical protein